MSATGNTSRAAGRRRTLVRRTAAAIGLCAVLTAATLGLTGVTPAVAAAGNSLRIDPAVQTVPQDGTFTTHILQTADVPTSGASATVTFDPTLLQIESVKFGAPYADAQVTTGATQAAVTAANTTGSLVQVAAAFLPPDSVPAGDAGFLDVTFKAIGCGTAQLGLPTGDTDAALLDGQTDTYGAALQVSTSGGSVTTCVASTPSPSATASGSPAPPAPSTASPAPTITPAPTPTIRPTVTPPPLPAGESIRIEPFYTGVVEGGGFTVKVVQRSTLPVSGAGATTTFDPTILQIVSVTKSPAYAAAPVYIGAGQSAITAANSSGKLTGVSTSFLTPTVIAPGEADFLIIEFKAIACGETELGLPVSPFDGGLNDGRLNTYGNPLTITSRYGIVQACDPKASPTPSPTPRPQPTVAPTAAPVVAPVATQTETAGVVEPPPVESTEPASQEPTSPPTAAPTQQAPEVALVASRTTTQVEAPPAVRNVALVGAGLAGVILATAIVFGLSAFLMTMLIAPFLVLRLRGARQRSPRGNQRPIGRS